MLNVFDIATFGAVGDGVTDCTVSVQAALDAAAACGGKVVVPPGVYQVGHLVMRGNGTALEGTSAWGFRSDGASTFRLNTPDVDCLLDITGAIGCSVRGMSFNGERLGEGVHGICLSWESFHRKEEDAPTIDDCRISSFTGDGLHFARVWCFSLRHCLICFNEGAGLFIHGWDAFILDNWISGNRAGGVVGGDYLATVTCTGNRVEWNRRAGFWFPKGDSFNLTGNFFDNTFGPAIRLGEVNLVTATGNLFRYSGSIDPAAPLQSPRESCHVLLEGSAGAVFTGNTMKVGMGELQRTITPDYGIILAGCESCLVRDNVMRNGAMKELFQQSDDCVDCIVDGNLGNVAHFEE